MPGRFPSGDYMDMFSRIHTAPLLFPQEEDGVYAGAFCAGRILWMKKLYYVRPALISGNSI